MARKKVVFLGQLGAPGRYDPAIFSNQPGGDNEILWFQLLLDDLGLRDAVTYEGHRICYGDPLPSPTDADAFIIGGSFHSVHDGLSWQDGLMAWLDAAWSLETPPPVFGICGGHQSMSQFFGADVAKIADGPFSATLPVTLTEEGAQHWMFRDVPLSFHFGNEDEVVNVPEGAVVLARRDGLPIAALDYGRGWSSVQFHPEATHCAMADSWGPKKAMIARKYAATPGAPLLLKNFLAANGVI